MGEDSKKYVGYDQLKQYDSLIKNYVTTKDNEHIEDYTYVDSNGTTIAVGGLPIGWKPDGSEMSVSDVLYAVLHPYVQPTVSFTGSGNKLEAIGNTINGVTLNISLIKTSETITNVSIEVNNIQFYSSSSYSLGGNFTYVYGAPITQNTTFKLMVTDNKGTVTNTINYSFVPYLYYGSSDIILSELESEDLSSLNTKLTSKGTNIITYNHTDKFCIFMCPISYGKLQHIYDQNGFEVSTGFAYKEILFNNISYYIYETISKATLSSFNYRFEY